MTARRILQTHPSARGALALTVAVLLALAMNAAAFLIDTPAMRQNAAQGTLMLEQEGAVPELVGGFKSAQLDNFSSVLILKTAAYTGPQTLLQKALGGYRADLPAQADQDEWEAFCVYGDGSDSPTGGLSYSRYWHGYTLPLRLLLCILNTANIQMLLLFSELALLCAVLAASAKRLPGLTPGLFAACFLLMPLAAGVCLQFAPVTLLMLAACLLVLLAEAQIARMITLPAFFALIGLATNYFDLLTFPLITLGFPLALSLALGQKQGLSLGALLRRLVGCGLAWGLGYAGMWTLKWLLVAAAFGTEHLMGIFTQAALRVSSSSNGETFSRLGALAKNIDVIFAKPAYLLILLLAAIASLSHMAHAGLILRRAGERLCPDARAAVFFLLMLVPIAWYLVMANHSYDHAFFTYRNLTVSVLSGCIGISYIFPSSNA